MDVVTLGDFTLGRGVFEPGWRWSNDVKPIAGTDSCQVHHTGLCLSGRMTIKPDGGAIEYWHEDAYYEFEMSEVETPAHAASMPSSGACCSATPSPCDAGCSASAMPP